MHIHNAMNYVSLYIFFTYYGEEILHFYRYEFLIYIYLLRYLINRMFT
jgi:hypothetical protein